MKQFRDFNDRGAQKIASFMSKYGIVFLRISLGILFLWFGVHKFFPGLSPASEIATKTIEKWTFGIIQPKMSIIIVATLEMVIGISLISRMFLRIILFLLFTQMLGTMKVPTFCKKNDFQALLPIYFKIT